MKIVALSDQHGHLPEISPCDLLIVAGDVCPDFGEPGAETNAMHQRRWFEATARPWLAAAPASHKVLTWGNHDWCGQAFGDAGETPTGSSTAPLQILVDARTSVPATAAAGRALSVWATPWSRQYMNWAFMKSSAELALIYAAIPDHIDILVSHQPPYGYGDGPVDAGADHREHLGSHELLAAIDRIKPRLVICGHIHSGYGHFEHGPTTIYNVSVVNDQYRLVRPATVIDIAGW